MKTKYLYDGYTEEVINTLAKNKDLSVTSRTFSFYFKNKKVTSKEIGEKLKVAIYKEYLKGRYLNEIRL